MLRKNITRRKFLQGVAVTGVGAFGASVLAACAAPAPAADTASDATDSSAAPAATDVTLRIQVPPEAGQSVMPTIMAERYMEESGVETIIEETIYGEIETKTQTGFISGTLQDLTYGHHRWLFINFLKGIYLEIDDLLASDPPEDFDDIYPSVMAGNSLDGKNFSIPGVVHPGGNIIVMFNKTKIEDKGLPLPTDGWTFDDWTQLAREAADPDAGEFGLGFDGMNSFHYYSNTSRSWGSPDTTDSWVMDAEGTELTFNTDLHREIGEWYLSLMDDKVAPRKADYIENSPRNLFLSGFNHTHAATVNGIAVAIDTMEDEVDAVLLPIGAEGRQGTCYSGNQHMINSATEHPEEAWDLMKLYSSGEAGVLMVTEGNLQPNGHKSAWTDADVNAINRMFGVTDALLTAGIEPFPMPKNTRFTEANNIFRNEIDLIWEGDESWEEYAPVIVEKVNEVLALDRP